MKIFKPFVSLALALIMIILSSGFSYAEPPKHKKKKPYNRLKKAKSEDRQHKFLKVWAVAGGVIIIWAVQDGIENRSKK